MQNQKSATMAGILGIFFGVFGAHWWYLGNKKKAWIHLGMWLATMALVLIAMASLPGIFMMSTAGSTGGLILILMFGAAILGAANEVWALVESVKILKGGDAGLVQLMTRTAMQTSVQTSAQTIAQHQAPLMTQSGQNGMMQNDMMQGGMQDGQNGMMQNGMRGGMMGNMQAPAPKKPMNPATKKKIMLGVGIGSGVVVVGIIVAVVVALAMKVDYGTAYREMKDLKVELEELTEGNDCVKAYNAVEYIMVDAETFDGYADSCLALSTDLAAVTKRLDALDALTKDKELQAKYGEFKAALEDFVPEDEGLEEKMAVLKSWHNFRLAAKRVSSASSKNITEADLDAAGKTLTDSSSETLRTYGEEWSKLIKAYYQAKWTEDNYNWQNYNQDEYQKISDDAHAKRVELNDYQKAHEPKVTEMVGEIGGSGSAAMNAYDDMYDFVRDKYEKNYNQDSGDCDSFGGIVYCD